MKIKKRYILIEAESKEKLEQAISDYIGILGWTKSKASFVSSNDGKIILAVDRKSVDSVRAAFELSNEKIKILKISGTLKGLTK